MIHEFSLLYFDESNQEEKRVQGYLSADDISFAADIIMDEMGLDPTQISSLKIERGKKFILI
jgi:hypothetical protein